VGERVRSFAGLLRASLPPSIELSVSTPASLSVVVDVPQLEQALLNLVVNARDAMPDGGRLEVAVEGRTDGEPRVARRVPDTGLGIPDDIRERVFEPLFTTKAEGHGTGLGLAVVYAFARDHGGQVELETELGRGTTFRILLPAIEPS